MRMWDRAAEARSSGVGVDLCLIGAVLRSTRSMKCRSLDWSSVWGVRCCGCRTGARFEDWALSSSSLSLSVFARESGNGLNWKFSLQTISGSKPLKHMVNWKYFLENLFSMCNQTPAFTEKYFWKWFETKTNTVLAFKKLHFLVICFVKGKEFWFSWIHICLKWRKWVTSNKKPTI